MRRTSYQRGFVAGEQLAAQFILERLRHDPPNSLDEVQRMVEALGPVMAVAGIVGKGIGGQDIEPHDYDEWAEEELRDERRRVEIAIEGALYFGTRGGEDDDEDRARGRAFLRVPEHLRDGLAMYLNEHLPTGHFLTAVLSNDLAEAFGRADLESRAGLFDLVSYLHNFAPRPAWGSKRQVELWLTPPIPQLEVRRLGGELAVIDGKTACPGCGGFHPVHVTSAPFGRVSLPEDGAMKQQHVVQFVYCQQVHCHVVGVEGREIES
jgi:hypothetical protein